MVLSLFPACLLLSVWCNKLDLTSLGHHKLYWYKLLVPFPSLKWHILEGGIQYCNKLALKVLELNSQRWSRGHKARGQGRGHKKNPRPRTAFPRTDPLEAKDRNARGQGQRPRTHPQVFSEKKKVFKKVFQAISNLQT